jgi:glucose/arabinose dehydrogenase
VIGRRGTLVAAALLVVAALTGCGAATNHARSGLVSIGVGLRGPAGLQAGIYARGVPTVAAFAFDAQGRLWAAAAGLSAHSHDGVYLIAQPGARPVRVIGGLDDPLGLVWLRGRLFVSSVGRVTAYSGLHGTRFAHRQTIIQGPVAGGENNDLVLAPDGRFVMGVTATCDHCTPKSQWSGSIVSFRPDGSDLRLFAARIRAPLGLDYFPGTSDLFVTMNQLDDLGARTPGDWLAVVRPGTDWRFPGCYGQGGAACAGMPGPIAVLDQHAAVGSVVIVTGQLGPTVGTSALVAEWQTAKVARVALVQRGSSYRGGPPEVWLRGLHNPLALVIGPGGSVLVGDWGTGIVYRITRRS